jgi:tetratricopeptide (TPR) repeat protein
MGRQEEAIAEMKRAQQVDPLTPLWIAWQGDLNWGVGDYQAAIPLGKKALDLNPDFPWGYLTLGIAYAGTGMYDEAIAAHRKAVAANPEWSWALGQTLALAGQTVEARKIAADLERANTPMAAFGLVVIYTALGDEDKAFRWAEATYRYRHPWTPWFGVMSMLKPLQDDSRFDDLRRRMNLPDRTRPAS